MFKKSSLSAIQKVFYIGFSAFLFGTGFTILSPKSSASPGSLEFQWGKQPGYKQLKYYQSSSDPLDRAKYYFFLRSLERKDNIIKLTMQLPEYFEAKIKSEKLSLCKVKIGGFRSKTRCLETIPSLIEVKENQTAIEIFPERPIPRNKDNYAVVMKIFNPRRTGMFQIQAISQSQQPGEIPISTYLGTWNVQVLGRVE
jgi:hypothetical protein